MKATKGLLILTLPLMAVGCGGSSTTSGGVSPPPPSVDPEGIFLTATNGSGSGDTIFGIVAADGTANFLEFSGDLSSLTTSTPFVILAPKAIVPDENGNYAVSYDGFSGNGYVLPSGDFNETGMFSGQAAVLSSLSGNYTVTGPIPAGIGVAPQSTTTINYNMAYQPSLYETPASSTIAQGSYSVALILGTSVFSGGTFNITAGTSATQADISGSDGSVCNFTGSLSVPDTTYNAYELSLQSSGSGCNHVFDNLHGMGTLLSINSQTVMVAMLSDKATGQGALVLLTQN